MCTVVCVSPLVKYVVGFGFGVDFVWKREERKASESERVNDCSPTVRLIQTNQAWWEGKRTIKGTTKEENDM